MVEEVTENHVAKVFKGYLKGILDGLRQRKIKQVIRQLEETIAGLDEMVGENNDS